MIKRRRLNAIQFVKRTQNDLKDDAMRDAKWFTVSLIDVRAAVG